MITKIYRSAPPRRESSLPLRRLPRPVWDAIKLIDQNFAEGATAVKIWMNIGMDLRNRNGQLIMADDPKFDPIHTRTVGQSFPKLYPGGSPCQRIRKTQTE
ncbi:MAG: hypothetical protein WA485_27660 [Candidatus Sulfotelmatobacter sp.]